MSDDLNFAPPADTTVQQTPAEATPAAPAAPIAATPQIGTQVPATGAPEVEPSWLRGRLNEVRSAATRQAGEQFAAREAQYAAALRQREEQLQRLTGVYQPQRNPEVDAVKEQFNSLYPGLAKLEQRSDAIEAFIERAQELEAQNQHYWDSYGRQTVDKLFTSAATALGGPLTDEGKGVLHQAFVGFVQSTPERQARYTNDPSLVDEFLRSFTSSFIDPVRRSAASQTATRAGQVTSLPQDTPSGALRTGSPATPANLDERAAMGWQAFVAAKNAG